MTAYRFGRFELDPARRELLVDGKTAAVGARALDVLQILIEERDRVVTKDELLTRAWPGVIVEENNLQVQVSALRKLLGASAIATVPGRGYRFAVESARTADPTAPAMAKAPPNSNLPPALGVLIGRERDLERLRALCAASRLVTVTGAGGVGKTRLAIEAAAGAADDFASGAWLVDLAALGDAARVADAVAAALGIAVPASLTARDILRQALRDEEALLLLDNCEHLVDAVASLTEALLAAAPRLRVLATSREPIGIAGEQVFRVPSLSFPLPDGDHPAETALAYGAVQLFVDRARAADPEFVLDTATWPAVAAICARLDGIPLALEMAAARAPILGVATLAKRLDERFRVLTVGKRTALPRQRTLHATLDWSFSLLTPAERTVFRRLGVFPGSFSLEAAATVAADAELDDLAVVDLLASLGAKSLVTAETASGQIRYRLLESARAYAQERLAEAGETAAVTRRHAQYLRTFFATCFDDWTRLSDADFLARYAPLLDDLRLAVEGAFAPDGDVETGIALVGASGLLWVALSLYHEADRMLDVAQAALTPGIAPALEAALWFADAATFVQLRTTRATLSARRAIELYRQIGDPVREGYAQCLLGSSLATARTDDAQAELSAAIPLLEAAHRPRLAAMAHGSRATVFNLRDARAEAAAAMERAIEAWRVAGVDSQVLRLRGSFADYYWAWGELDRAIDDARDMLVNLRASRFSNRVTIAYLFANLFGMLVERGDLTEARTVGRDALRDLRDLGIIAGWAEHFALYAAKVDAVESAAQILGWSMALRERGAIHAQANEARAHGSTLALLHAALPAPEQGRLLAEGAMLSDDDGYELIQRVFTHHG